MRRTSLRPSIKMSNLLRELGREAARWSVMAALVSGCSDSGNRDSPPAGDTQQAALAKASAAAPQGVQINPAIAQAGKWVRLTGNTHPAAIAQNIKGNLPDTFQFDYLQLVLKRSPEQEAALQVRMEAMQDKNSPLFHHWLTAEEFGTEFGVAKADLDAATNWLTSQGFRVDGVPASRMYIAFSGTAAQVRNAFHTQLVELSVRGEPHFANLSDPEIPEELAKTVVGIHSLHNFMPKPMSRQLGQAKKAKGVWSIVKPAPDFNVTLSGTNFQAIAPADFATIYNLNPLFSAGITGNGQTIAVLSPTDLKNTADVTTFRAAFGLSGYRGTFAQIHPTGATTCADPGPAGPDSSAEGEAALDAEWSGATAPDANIVLASCASTSTVFGTDIALQNLVNSSSPPRIISYSYGICEAFTTTSDYATYVTTYQQAAAEGISVFVAAGDQGAAVCDANATKAINGISVSALASTPYNVAVGGTDLMDAYDSLSGGPALSTYWASTNTSTFGSALSYIPEIPWNNSCAGKLQYTFKGYTQAYGSTGYCNSTTGRNFRTTAAGSGGPSVYSSQPSWQTGVVGLPSKSGGMRYLPDISLFAASGLWGHFYVFCMSDTAQSGATCDYTNATDVNALAAGGTSFAAPALAGIQALINQKMGASQGNPNYKYYKLAAAEFGQRGSTRCNSTGGTAASPVLPKSSCIFNDITQGDIDVNCTGTTNCFGASGTTIHGVLSTSSTTLSPAYNASTGWDYATGLGSVNAYNLVTAWSN